MAVSGEGTRVKLPAGRVGWQRAWWRCCEGMGRPDAHDAGFTATAKVGRGSPAEVKLDWRLQQQRMAYQVGYGLGMF